MWDRLIRIEDWPTWHLLYKDMTVSGPAAIGARFSYRNNGTRIRAEVTTLVPPTTFEFVGRAWGVTARNRWQLIVLDPTTTKVVIREEMQGLLPWLLRASFNRELGNGLEAWLSALDRSLST